MASGNCNCGAVSFEIDEDPTDVYVCHCSICRRATGSHGIAVVLVPKARFRWISGAEALACWRKPDGDWQMNFCRHCGSPAPGENDPDHLFVPAGSLSTGIDGLRVVHHIWVGSKAPWDVIGDSGRQHAESFQP